MVIENIGVIRINNVLKSYIKFEDRYFISDCGNLSNIQYNRKMKLKKLGNIDDSFWLNIEEFYKIYTFKNEN